MDILKKLLKKSSDHSEQAQAGAGVATSMDKTAPGIKVSNTLEKNESKKTNIVRLALIPLVGLACWIYLDGLEKIETIEGQEKIEKPEEELPSHRLKAQTENANEAPAPTAAKQKPQEEKNEEASQLPPQLTVAAPTERGPSQEQEGTHSKSELPTQVEHTAEESVGQNEGPELETMSESNPILKNLENQEELSSPEVQLGANEKVLPLMERDYEYLGAGLVYNCAGKHWACVNKSIYLRCAKEKEFSLTKGDKTGCAPASLFNSDMACIYRQRVNIDNLVDPPEACL